jgi:hypothetical protein
MDGWGVTIKTTVPARRLFERIVSLKAFTIKIPNTIIWYNSNRNWLSFLKTSTQNMKTIFKKFIVFESKQGSAASVDAAKAKMKLYVNSFAWW